VSRRTVFCIVCILTKPRTAALSEFADSTEQPRFPMSLTTRIIHDSLFEAHGCSSFIGQAFDPAQVRRCLGMHHCPHIVVVEDEDAQRKLLVDYLSQQKFRVTGVDGGIALRRAVERELPALVLLDVGLPGEDGFALARWLREKKAVASAL